jgi:PAS domain S-box-containing protein
MASQEASAEELRNTLRELKGEVERLRLLFDRSRDLLILHDMKGRILDANTFACRRLGYSRQALLASTVGDINPQVGAIPLEELGKNWAAMPLDGAIPVETIMRHKDGEDIPMEVLVAPFLEKGERLFVAVGRDITERKKAETELKRGERRFQAIFEAAPTGMLILDDEDAIAEANPAISRMLGYAGDQLLGKALDEITYSEDLEIGRKFRQELRAGEREHYKMEKRFLHSCGEPRWTQVSAFRDEDPHTGTSRIAAFLEDISERKAVEDMRRDMVARLDELVEERTEQLQKEIAERRRTEQHLNEAMRDAEAANLAKSQFLAGMSHELRTPLNAVIGYSELLMDDALDAGMEEFTPDLHKIRGAGKHLLGIINDVLDLSKVEAGKIELFIEEVDMGGLVAEVLSTIRPLVDKNDNLLESDIEVSAEIFRTDVTRVRQILFNLLSNACKFTESGRIQLKVSSHALKSRNWLRCTISDTGLGIKPHELELLFKPFTQADASTSRRFGGTGLGLSISDQFAKMLGGRIEVASEFGQGSTFTFWLPSAAEGSSAGTSRPGTPIPTLGESATVLVIDDDDASRELLARMLEAQGYSTLEAESGLQALELAAQHEPDLITLDVLMPGMDGWAVLSRLKEIPKLAAIPVVVVSLVRDKGIGYALGAADFINKPIDRERLVAVVDRFRPDRGPANILVIDDEPEARELVRHAVEREGWSVEEAANGPAGLELMRAQPPRVVILDLMMPVMDGFEVLNEIRSDERLRELPVVIVTAKELEAEEREFLSRRVSSVMEKASYSRADLVKHLHSLIDPARPEG